MSSNGKKQPRSLPHGLDDLRLSIIENGKEKSGMVDVGVGESGKEDPFDIKINIDTGTPWKDLTGGEKLRRIAVGIAKVVGLLTLLYFFVCSLDCLSLGFRLVGGKTTGEIFRQSDIIQNPVVGVMIGILTTVLVQSSSTSTSIIVSMVSSGFLDVKAAIPIVMGANIGTSVTNTIVSLTQAGDRNQFRRAFAGATVHDMFNWLTVISLLIVEVTTGYLYHLTSWIMGGISQNGSGGEVEILGKITKPFVNLIVQLDSGVLTCWAEPNCTKHDNSSLLKEICTPKKSAARFLLPPAESTLPIFEAEESLHPISEMLRAAENQCKYLFHGTSMSDVAVGLIVLLTSLLVLCICLILIVKILNSVLQGQIAVVIQKTLNADIKYIPWITGYIAIIVGAIMTFLVQSSSVFTSALTPLVGVGVITVDRVYPLTLGSNIGTTTTALIAALAVDGDKFYPSLQVALCHFFFNVTGILLFYPIPFMRFPIGMAKFLGKTTAQYRWFAVAYMILMFLVLPAIVMGLSFAGTIFVIIFAAIVVFVFGFVLIVNLINKKKPGLLPEALQSWDWLPEFLRSLEPYDRILLGCGCCKRLRDAETAAVATPIRQDVEINPIPGPDSKDSDGGIPHSRNGYVNRSFEDPV